MNAQASAGTPAPTVASPAEWHAWYRTMRAAAPVWYDEAAHTWHVFRYDDVQQVCSDYNSFSSNFDRLRTPEQRAASPAPASLVFSDPPLHRKLRTLVTQAFTPQAIAALEPRIRAIVAAQLDAVSAQGRMDLINDLAVPLPVTVIAEMLGVPVADRADFKRCSDQIVRSGRDNASRVANGEMNAAPGFLELHTYLSQLIEQRRAAPRDDLISHLLAAQLDGQALTQQELTVFGTLLLVAGNETTTSLLGSTILCFEQHPEVWPQLRADPSLVPSAIEEVLRYRPPVRGVTRVTTGDVTLGGQTIPANAIVRAWLAAANLDQSQFVDPEHFDIRRTPNRHLSFGHGIHFCLGAPLARLETRIALELMVQRFVELGVVPGTPIEPVEELGMYIFRQLPVQFRLAEEHGRA